MTERPTQNGAAAPASRRDRAGRDIAVLDRLVRLTPPDQASPLLLGPLSCILPTNRVMAVLGRQRSGRSTLLRLLGGFERADAGGVLSGAKFSMVLNGAGYLHGGMTGIENIGIMARMHGMNANQMTRLAVALPFIDSDMWYLPIGDLEPPARRSLELVLAMLLPYDCYLIDDAERADDNVLGPVIKWLAARGAGVIFTAYKARYARQYADCAAVISKQNLVVFDSVKEAEQFYDR